jgi:copper chaperone CopZ
MDSALRYRRERAEGADRCNVEPVPAKHAVQSKGPFALVEMAILNVDCPACAARVKHALLAVPGVLDVDVQFETGVGNVLYDPMRTYSERLADVVFKTGRASHHEYLATVTRVQIMATPERGIIPTSLSS